jgi:hypothetical protein
MKLATPFLVLLSGLALTLATASPALAVDYHVGPGQALEEPAGVPWQTLNPGDNVYIHARPQPYKAKWVIARRGEPDKPIRIMGVPDPASGALPVIVGIGAAVPPGLDYSSADRAIIKIGSARFAGAAERPGFIEIQDLELRGALTGETFINQDGTEGVYRVNAAAIHIEIGDQITVRHCTLQGNSQGLSSAYLAHNVSVERCRIYNNGNPGSISEHNIYTESRGIQFLYNHLGPLSDGARGNNIKDRSSGLVVGWNWIEGGNRLLDLVDTTHQEVLDDPGYKETFVFGNVMIKTEGVVVSEQPDATVDENRKALYGIIDDGTDSKRDPKAPREKPKPIPKGDPAPTPDQIARQNNQVIHYGGDSLNFPMYRVGKLYLDHNTIISRREGATVLLRLSTAEQRVVVSNCLVALGEAQHNRFYIITQEGSVDFVGPSLLPNLWREFADEISKNYQITGQENIIASNTSFSDVEAKDYRLQAHSRAVKKAGDSPPQLAKWPVASRVYKPHQGYEDLAEPNRNLGALGTVKSRPIGQED